MGKDKESYRRKKKSDKSIKTRQVNGPYSTRSARISQDEKKISFASVPLQNQTS